MKIAAILHKVIAGRKENYDILRENIARAVSDFNPDLIVGPDYGLNYSPSLVSSNRFYQKIVSDYKLISAKAPNTLIMPGTILYPINGQEMVCEAPVFLNGKLNRQLWKDRDNGEAELAAKAGFAYKRGSHENKKFEHKGKKIAVEICGDHGRQDVRGCDLEVILAFDKLAGFWLGAQNDSFVRKVILCDSYAPKIESWDYNPKRQPKQIEIKGKQEGNIFTFEI